MEGDHIWKKVRCFWKYILYKKSQIKNIGGFDTRGNEGVKIDYDICFDLFSIKISIRTVTPESQPITYIYSVFIYFG